MHTTFLFVVYYVYLPHLIVALTPDFLVLIDTAGMHQPCTDFDHLFHSGQWWFCLTLVIQPPANQRGLVSDATGVQMS